MIGGGEAAPAGPRGLAPLLAFESLEVGPVRLERNRLFCPYRVTAADRHSSFQLIFSYEETVFDPKEASSRNLAGMVAAQAALNYALFCRRIRFRGLFDAADRRLLAGMAENTAREIYVNKLLAPNRFLPALPELPLLTRGPYAQARLQFDRDEGRAGGAAGGEQARAPGGNAPRFGPWGTDRRRYAVLSSGGKESLLSYGLLEELSVDHGLEVHPVFVNESGRHWFTALNAYRHLRRADGRTARVWTNSDRLFNWLLRNMAFVRQDFPRLKADYYPIRLWTLAVFVFAALPLLRKRRVAHLVIGNEHDTTQKALYRGIAHYNGLYDQSRWFDTALSRYYESKGWAVRQLSLLRPLSELLIEKVLVERYPELQRQQVSCHAAHIEGPRVVPCGACEKCRRIVGMLTALGADPGRCGFTAEQIRRSLAALNEENLHQEAGGVRQLLFLLGRAEEGSPEIMKLRFDPLRSPVEDYPPGLRDGLLDILLEHAGGAVTREGGHRRDRKPGAGAGSAAANDLE